MRSTLFILQAYHFLPKNTQEYQVGDAALQRKEMLVICDRKNCQLHLSGFWCKYSKGWDDDLVEEFLTEMKTFATFTKKYIPVYIKLAQKEFKLNVFFLLNEFC